MKNGKRVSMDKNVALFQMCYRKSLQKNAGSAEKMGRQNSIQKQIDRILKGEQTPFLRWKMKEHFKVFFKFNYEWVLIHFSASWVFDSPEKCTWKILLMLDGGKLLSDQWHLNFHISFPTVTLYKHIPSIFHTNLSGNF